MDSSCICINIIFLIVFFGVVLIFLIFNPLGNSYASYFFRFVNWFIFIQYIKILDDDLFLSELEKDANKFHNMVFGVLIFLVFFINILASGWEYFY